VLKRFDYPRRNKGERGVLLAYLRHTSGYSRPQLTRLVTRWHANRLAPVRLGKRYAAPGAPFACKYTAGDIALLVEMDRANAQVCGPAIAHLLKRAYSVYGNARYERLATLSVSHLYNLRKSAGYWFLLPVLALLIAQFPFVIEGFHSDNGSEYINARVAQLLEKLRIERPNRAHATATTTPWPRARTRASCASTWATATSRNDMPN